VIRNRLKTYHEKTEPLIEFFDHQSLLRRIDGTASPDEVAAGVARTLATLKLEADEAI
jgi:adenylate kinase